MLTQKLTKLLTQAFADAGYDPAYGEVVISNRPDLCQFQCNGAMPAAKQYKKAPFLIAEQVITQLSTSDSIIANIELVKPGFININVSDQELVATVDQIQADTKLGVSNLVSPQTIVIDYGGPNIAKPLHVGHLRPAIIGESLKRILRFSGHQVIGDVHLGDWGLQMGMIISDIEARHPELPYFDDQHTGSYPATPPFRLTDLEEIYPRVSQAAKQDEAVYAAAKQATVQLQQKKPGYMALWKHIVAVSLADIKHNYQRLGVDFDLWYGESDAQDYIEPTLDLLRQKDVLYCSDGAYVVDVSCPEDKNEMPPLILIKSDGSYIYGTTDLATIHQRVLDFNPDQILYVVDSRQATHFSQVFRCASHNQIVQPQVELEHIGFGTMNGKDGKPFKTRDGGILRLSALIDMVEDNIRQKVEANYRANNVPVDQEEIQPLAATISLATLKFADLSNYRLKDYVFDLDKFSSFEGKTGPYILYSGVRIKNIIRKLEQSGLAIGPLLPPDNEAERKLMLQLDKFASAVVLAGKDRAPNILAEYIYELATLVNGFYHSHHILNQSDEAVKKSWYQLLLTTLAVLQTGLELLGIEIPEKM